MKRLSGPEIRHTVLFALIFSSRMLGLFMIYPVLALYAVTLPGANAVSMGIAMGIYGLSQAIFQLPLGWLSDRYGRKPVVLVGLGVFAIGSLLAAFSHTIMGIIIGRAVQGAGAIGSPVLAWVADTTREVVRTRAMAIIGVTIGLTFGVSLVLGPWLAAMVGLQGLFGITAGAAGVGIVGVMLLAREGMRREYLSEVGEVVGERHRLWRLYSGIFVIHAVLTAIFLVLPLKVREVTGWTEGAWKFYLPVLGLSLLLVAPFFRRAEGGVEQYYFLRRALGILGISIAGLWWASSGWWLGISAVGFFAGFNFLEASLPAMVSRVASARARGLALGGYSCAQFLGLFVGGVLGGYVDNRYSHAGIYGFCISLVIITWCILKMNSRGGVSWREG